MLSSGPVRIPAVTVWIAGVTIAVYVLQQLPVTGQLLNGGMAIGADGLIAVPGIGALIPARVFMRGELWRLFTYLCMHGSPGHLLFNLITLWFCGMYLEPFLGWRRFLAYYLIGGIGAGLFSAFMWSSVIIGASGAVLALLAVFAWHFPHAQILVFFVIPVPARVFVAIAAIMSVLFAVSGSGGNIAHITHLGGILVGLACVKLEPAVLRHFENYRSRQREAAQRDAAEKRARQDRYFADTIDPLLKKISQQGMDSLNAAEKKQLFEASRRNRERFGRERIVPFDFS